MNVFVIPKATQEHQVMCKCDPFENNNCFNVTDNHITHISCLFLYSMLMFNTQCVFVCVSASAQIRTCVGVHECVCVCVCVCVCLCR